MESWFFIFRLFIAKNTLYTILINLFFIVYEINAEILQFPICTSIPTLSKTVPLDTAPELNAFLQQLKHNDIIMSNAERRIAVLPEVGTSAELILVNNTETVRQTNTLNNDDFDLFSKTKKFDFFPQTTCGIRLEACANCIIRLTLEPVLPYFTESQIEKISNCDDSSSIWEPCFNLILIEEKADRPLPLQSTINMGFHSSSAPRSTYYRRISTWNIRDNQTRYINTTSSSLLVFVVLRNIEQDQQLSEYIRELFPIQVFTYENTEVIIGQSPKSLLINHLSAGYIESPRFPQAYPRILAKNYTLLNNDSDGFIRLTFDDFHVHYFSELKIIDSNGQELFNTRLQHQRPPAIVSSGNSLIITFLARSFTQNVGFKARYEFVDAEEWPQQPTSRNCDEYVENYGGQISLENRKDLIGSYIDCIWLIGRFPSILPSLDHQIYLKVEKFHLRGNSLRFEIRQGSNSASEKVMSLTDEQSTEQLNAKQSSEGIVTNLLSEEHLASAFYVRLRGFLTFNEGLTIVYAHFYRWATALCPGNNEFHCDNSKCIKNILRCDGFNHCSDFSDEICHLSDTVVETSSVNVPNLLTLIVGVVSTMLVLIMIVALTSTVTHNSFFCRISEFPFLRSRQQQNIQNNSSSTIANLNDTNFHQSVTDNCQHYRQNLRSNNAVQIMSGNITRSSTLYTNESIINSTPSIQTFGDRRFYVLPPEHQINIIEAPPTYNDALKHPAVPSDRRQFNLYDNIGFRMSLPEMVIASGHNDTAVFTVVEPTSTIANRTENIINAQNGSNSSPTLNEIENYSNDALQHDDVNLENSSTQRVNTSESNSSTQEHILSSENILQNNNNAFNSLPSSSRTTTLVVNDSNELLRRSYSCNSINNIK